MSANAAGQLLSVFAQQQQERRVRLLGRVDALRRGWRQFSCSSCVASTITSVHWLCAESHSMTVCHTIPIRHVASRLCCSSTTEPAAKAPSCPSASPTRAHAPSPPRGMGGKRPPTPAPKKHSALPNSTPVPVVNTDVVPIAPTRGGAGAAAQRKARSAGHAALLRLRVHVHRRSVLAVSPARLRKRRGEESSGEKSTGQRRELRRGFAAGQGEHSPRERKRAKLLCQLSLMLQGE